MTSPSWLWRLREAAPSDAERARTGGKPRRAIGHRGADRAGADDGERDVDALGSHPVEREHPARLRDEVLAGERDLADSGAVERDDERPRPAARGEVGGDPTRRSLDRRGDDPNDGRGSGSGAVFGGDLRARRAEETEAGGVASSAGALAASAWRISFGIGPQPKGPQEASTIARAPSGDSRWTTLTRCGCETRTGAARRRRAWKSAATSERGERDGRGRGPRGATPWPRPASSPTQQGASRRRRSRPVRSSSAARRSRRSRISRA